MDALKEFLCPLALWGGLGLFFSVAVGHIVVVPCFMRPFEKWMKFPQKDDDPDTKDFPPWLTGCIERAIFAIWIGAAGPSSQVVLGMGAWLGLKLATNWNRRKIDGASPAEKQQATRIMRQSWLALMSGVLSMAMAFVGGFIMWKGLMAGTYDPLNLLE